MSDEKLENVAAKLDDISETLEELKAAAEECAPVDERTLDAIQSQVDRAATAIEGTVDED